MSTQRNTLFVLGGALGACIIALVVAVGVIVQQTGEYAPLGEYPVQRVESRVPGYDTPAVRFSDGEIVITGTKCATEATKVEGFSTWTEIVPGGSVVPTPKGTGARDRGCTTRTFHNAFPAEVAERVLWSASRGRLETVWQLSGVETPIAPDGREGVKAGWQSQNFTIIFDEGEHDGDAR